MYSIDLLNRREKAFVLWTPGVPSTRSAPKLLLGVYDNGLFTTLVHQPLSQSPDTPGLWELETQNIDPPLSDGVYHYWFEFPDKIADPFAFTVDYTHMGDRRQRQEPPAVIKFRDGKLWPCDIDGKESPRALIPPTSDLPANNHLVIYELPTSWSKSGTDGTLVDVDVGTFSDVKALFDIASPGRRFASIEAVKNQAILSDLGINALELLPTADANPRGEWGYATASYFSPDYDLGSPSELVELVEVIHSQRIRFFTDVVMAFGHDSYVDIDFSEFHIDPQEEPSNPDSWQSPHSCNQLREGWGGRLWRYIRDTVSYDPETGNTTTVHPSWAFHKSHLTRWMKDFGVGGLRLDSVNNIANWDFVRAYKEKAWELYNARHNGQGDPSKFLVVGEELSMPITMIQQGCLDALWNERWQARLRQVLIGQSLDDNFEWTLRKLVNCTLDNLDQKFTDGSQAVNYITSHDIEGGIKKMRFFNYCKEMKIADVEKRAKLAFAMLLTSVGIPMIFAGEEFADQQDQDMPKKQTDPVNYERKTNGGWRSRLFQYVARLVKFRTACPALGTNDTDFFHVDQSRDAKIMAWRRGHIGGSDPVVVVVANFTDQNTPGSEYVVPNWPEKEHGKWREVTQNRDVPAEWVGREPLYSWEAKVYTYRK